VTVCFADIKDSIELIKDLDPEAAQQLLDPATHIMMEAVHRFEGTVNQVLGDGIMSIFGAPMRIGILMHIFLGVNPSPAPGTRARITPSDPKNRPI
jgi:hypothetical protein